MGEKGLQINESQVELQRLPLKDIRDIVGEAGTREPKEGFEMVCSSIVVVDGGEKNNKMLVCST